MLHYTLYSLGEEVDTSYQGTVTKSSSFLADPCPLSGCPDPVVPPLIGSEVRWSSRSTWNGSMTSSGIIIDHVDEITGLPAEDSTIILTKNVSLMLDVDKTRKLN
jgi:hypothetical protein